MRFRDDLTTSPMDAEDRTRTRSNKAKLLAFLRERGSCTNEQARRIAGSRAMARAWELQKDGHRIDIRKLTGGLWEIRYEQPPLGRDAGVRAQQKTLFTL